MRKLGILVTLLIVGMALIGCAATTPVGYEVPAQIESVDVTVAESFPVQVRAHIVGYLADGCTTLGAITQTQEGNTITVTVIGNHSGAEVCTMIAPVVNETITINGPLAFGDYTLIVNGYETSFSV